MKYLIFVLALSSLSAFGEGMNAYRDRIKPPKGKLQQVQGVQGARLQEIALQNEDEAQVMPDNIPKEERVIYKAVPGKKLEAIKGVGGQEIDLDKPSKK